MTLNSICDLIVDCPHTTDQDQGIGFPIIRTPNVGRGRLIMDGVFRVDNEVYDNRNKRGVPQKDDIILAREAPAGNFSIIKNEGQVCLGQRTVLLRPNKKKVYPDYLIYYLLAPLQQHNLLSTANGITVSHVNMSTIRSLPIRLPDMNRQIVIGNTLANYDDLIENNRRQIKLLEEAAQRLYKEWFIDLRFPGWEETPIVDGLPGYWHRVRLGDIANIVMGQSPKSEFFNARKEGLPFHQGVGSFGNRFVIDDTYSLALTRIGEAGSILFSVRAPVGRLNLTKNRVVIGRGIAAVNSNYGHQSLLFYMLKDRFFEDDLIGNGSIFGSINKDELHDLTFIYPSAEIADAFNFQAKAYDEMISVLHLKIQDCQLARDALLPKLINGELEV